MNEIKVSNCVSAAEVRFAYLQLAASGVCGGKAGPCMKDHCPLCAEVNELISVRGDECLDRGCTLRACVYDA